ncbi:MAG: DUF4143 domain-containing protein [Clostridiales bacterium]|nr:DUF4143 domain-containing protein [Clostridiales bacterium]
MSILVASHLVYLLQPYHNTITKLAVKTHILYFLDTGLAAFRMLDRIPNIKRGQGGVLCLYDNLVTLSGNDKVIPITLL